MKQLILTVGASSSGKSFWAESFIRNRDNWVNLNRDDVRFNTFTQGKRDWLSYKFSKKNENRVTKIIEGFSEEAVAQGCNIIVSDTNLSEKTRNKWKQFAKDNNYTYSEKLFVEDWDTLRKRNLQREGGIEQGILWSQYLRMNDYVGRTTYKGNPLKSDAVIIDIDGTVASMEGIRKPFEWDKVGLDSPRQEVIDMVQGILTESVGTIPIFLSGRDGCCLEDTYDWILENVMYGDRGFYLFMRDEGDSRKDKVVKEELFWKYIANNFNVISAIDDRKSVLELWEELRIPNIINVGKLYERF